MSDDIARRTLLAGAVMLFAGAANAQEAPRQQSAIVRTRHGRVQGFLDQGVNVFKGVPYGADTRPRRFRPALTPTAWRDVKETIAFGPRAAQQPSSGASVYFPVRPEEPVSEDVLKLNVWSPQLGRSHRPVLVWIHGGGFINGSANSDLYDGVNLVKKGDVVVVSMNHRLNAFGHTYLAELGGARYADSGNVGMLDLVLMLQWVRDNIGAFGGDPGNITIFGQSGGGAKCSVLMAMPAARGLFHKVMTMSGQQVTVMPAAMATANARALLEHTQLTPETIGQLETMSTDQLIAASRGFSSTGYTPVLDGRTLTRDPFEPDATPLSRDIPLIMGNTHDETRLLLGAGDAALFDLAWETLPGKINQHIARFLGTLTPDQVVAWYRDAYPTYSPSEIFFAASTALRSWRAQLIQAERRAAQQGASTWVYQFDWQSPVAGGKWGAPHAGDIPFVFNNIAYGERMTGNGPEAHALAEKMSDALLAFARTGDPNTPSLPSWPKYTLQDRAAMLFDNECAITNDPRGDERRLLLLIPYRQPGT